MAGALVISLATGLLLVFSTPAAVAGHVSPHHVDSNATCGGLTDLEELHREENPSSASVDIVIGGTTFTLSWVVQGDNTFDWSASGGLLVFAVFAKGGSGGGGNLYDYRPIGGETSDTGLHALINKSGTFAGLSHISFCGDVQSPTTSEPTTATTDDTTTTSIQVTSSTVESTTTSIGESSTSTTIGATTEATTTTIVATSTTVPAVTTTSMQQTTTIVDEVLAFTGPEDEGLGLIALALAALGALVVVGERSLSYAPAARSFVRKRCRRCDRNADFMTPHGGMCRRHTRRALNEDGTLWMPRKLL